MASDMQDIKHRIKSVPEALYMEITCSFYETNFKFPNKRLPGPLSWACMMRAPVEADIYYIQNWSVWLDIWLIIKTVWVVFKRKGAY